jgi:hypothetical protein
MDFPEYILVASITGDKYMLLMPERVGVSSTWKFNIVESPGNLITDGVWHDGHEILPWQITHYRESRRRGATEVFSGGVWRTGRYMSVSWNPCIYEYGFSRPNTYLPREYYKVNTNQDISRKWHFVVGEMPILVPPELPEPFAPAPVLFYPARSPARYRSPTPPARVTVTAPTPPASASAPPPASASAPPPARQQIPTHVFHAFVEASIRNGEDCPITMEPLTRENVAAPLCGHLFIYESLKRSVETSPICPTCRANININEIQRW